MRSTIDKATLLSVLQRCRQLVIQSNDSVWSCMSVAELLNALDREIWKLEESSPVEIDFLRFLFAPTGPLQDTSISNTWADEFLALAERFDKIIGERG